MPKRKKTVKSKSNSSKKKVRKEIVREFGVALIKACEMGYIDLVKMLILKQRRSTRADSLGYRGLHFASEKDILAFLDC